MTRLSKYCTRQEGRNSSVATLHLAIPARPLDVTQLWLPGTWTGQGRREVESAQQGQVWLYHLHQSSPAKSQYVKCMTEDPSRKTMLIKLRNGLECLSSLSEFYSVILLVLSFSSPCLIAFFPLNTVIGCFLPPPRIQRSTSSCSENRVNESLGIQMILETWKGYMVAHQALWARIRCHHLIQSVSKGG